MKRRLQQLEVETPPKSEEIDHPERPIEEENVTPISTETTESTPTTTTTTNFRFPIIPDREVYGWEQQTTRRESNEQWETNERYEEPTTEFNPHEMYDEPINEWRPTDTYEEPTHEWESSETYTEPMNDWRQKDSYDEHLNEWRTKEEPPLTYESQLSGKRVDEDYEIVPLRENDRWPGRNEKEGAVYRSTAKNTAPLPKPSYAEYVVRAKPEPETEPVAKEQTKKWKEPFTPTDVASPIYGLRDSSPISAAMEKIHSKKIQEEAVAQEETVATEPPTKGSIAEAMEQLEKLPLFASSTEKRKSLDELDRICERQAISESYERTPEHFETKHSQENSTTAERLEESVIVEPDAFEESLLQEQEARQVTEEVKLQDELESPVETEPEMVLEVESELASERAMEAAIEASYEYDTLDESDMDQTVNELPIERVESLVAATIEQTDEEVEEKIIPFNVMMLSSDKEKLTVSHAKGTSTKELQKNVPVTDQSTVQATTEEECAEELDEVEPPAYVLPPMSYLAPPEEEVIDKEWLEAQSAKLEETLSYFAIQATVENAVQGPAVTMFELTVEQGVKVSKIRNLTDDLKLALAAKDIRIQAPIPGTSMIGIEIPNRQTRAVRISEVIDSEAFRNSDSPLEAVLGLSLTGEPQTLDLRKMPHGMIAGATGSGKSVCINSLLISLLYKTSHRDLKLLLIDPKMVELAPYNGIPHLLSPVITDVKAATAALKWAVQEMERRYELFAHSSVRNIERYNEMVMESRRFSLKMPYILVVIDELADLMMMAPADVEVSISRITQKARACGIHLIIATQRPSVDVITGTIKANIPTRIAFAVSSQVDSRTILDTVGADRLLGKGDMLYLGNGQSAPVRLQGTFVTDDEIERIIEHVRKEADPEYLFGQDDLLAAAVQEEETDPLFQQACNFIIEQGSASTSALQRQFSIGYNRAAKLIDRMEANEFISEQRGSRPRDVFLTEQTFESFMK